MGSETREIVMAFSREFGETESPPRWDMKMERCLGRWLKGPLFLFELQSEVVMRNRLVLLAALMWCLSGVAAAAPAMDIVLYPSSAQVQVDDTLPVKNGAVAFVVPAGTDLESLVISLDKGEVISRRAIPVLVADSETVAALRQDLAEARAHAAGRRSRSGGGADLAVEQGRAGARGFDGGDGKAGCGYAGTPQGVVCTGRSTGAAGQGSAGRRGAP